MSPVRSTLIVLILIGSLGAGVNAARTIDLGGVPFTSVFDFETPGSDRIYLTGKLKFEKWSSFTGRYGVTIAAGQSVRLRIGAAMVGREFPGRWKFLGFHTRASGSARLRVRWHEAGLVREAVQVDIASTTREWMELFNPTHLEKLELEFINESTDSVIGIDDFILCDPELMIQSAGAGTIGLERNQLGWYVEANGRRMYAGRWDPMSDAVNPIEWSPMRVVFADARGGRFSFDSHGVRRPVESEPLLDIELIDDSARMDRNSQGDLDHDGYNESTGSYHIRALTPSVQLQISPIDKPVERALIEVVGLPPGEVRVIMEGELLDRIHQFKDGRVLIELPITIDRAIQIEIRSIEIP